MSARLHALLHNNRTISVLFNTSVFNGDLIGAGLSMGYAII